MCFYSMVGNLRIFFLKYKICLGSYTWKLYPGYSFLRYWKLCTKTHFLPCFGHLNSKDETGTWKSYFDILPVPQKIVHSCEPPKTYETSLRFLTTYLDRRQQMTVFWEIEISDKKGLFWNIFWEQWVTMRILIDFAHFCVFLLNWCLYLKLSKLRFVSIQKCRPQPSKLEIRLFAPS